MKDRELKANYMTCSIYGLYDPRDGSLRYIGKANDPIVRMKGHIRDAQRRKTPVYSWISKLISDGLCPEMRVICVCPSGDWQAREKEEIASARERGERLLNLADGGDEPYCPAEVRAKNGRKVAKMRVATDYKSRVYVLKREMGRLLKEGSVSEKNKQKLRLAAQKAPHLFGCYAGI